MRCSGLVATCEVWGLFQQLVSNDHIGRAEVNQQRQVLIPDFRIQLSSPNSQSETRLTVFKFTYSRDVYKPGVRQRQFKKAVNIRADRLMEEYREKADDMDTLLGEEGQGIVRRRLDQFGVLVGLVVVQFNEASDDINMLLEQMADSRPALLARK